MANTFVIAVVVSAAAFAAAPHTIMLTGTDRMKFDRKEITVQAGESVRVVLKSVGTLPKRTMAHNFVLVEPKTDLARFSAEAFNARDTDFVPPDMKDAVLAQTGLAGAGETVDVTFTAPSKPGRYPYFCSFPGHFSEGMRGVLEVK